jgi:hypothetical protein
MFDLHHSSHTSLVIRHRADHVDRQVAAMHGASGARPNAYGVEKIYPDKLKRG